AVRRGTRTAAATSSFRGCPPRNANRGSNIVIPGLSAEEREQRQQHRHSGAVRRGTRTAATTSSFRGCPPRNANSGSNIVIPGLSAEEREQRQQHRHSGAVRTSSGQNPESSSSFQDNRCQTSMREPAVYILASKPNGTLYVGVTSDLVKRIWEHRNDAVEGFTRRYGVYR